MSNYDFSTLGSPDLENLVCDLLNAQHKDDGINYRTFKDGKDKGIDLLYSTDNNKYEHVGQVKHYYRTGFTKLIYDLEKTELAKVRKLSPNKYIIATSVDLLEAEAERIFHLFTPFCKNLSDVLGKADINRLIDAYDNVLDKHFKLWFNNTYVLEKILHSGMYYRSADFIENELKKRLRLYVETPILENTRKSLENHNFVIITGEPGIGKSTLAEILCYEFIKDGYSFLYINGDIREAEHFIKPNDDKQIVYYDDFLGSNAAEINKSEGRESVLTNLIRRIRSNINKKLILTTRTHILNSVIQRSEKLKRSNIRLGESSIKIEEYNLSTKSILLENHIGESDLKQELKEILYDQQIFSFIVNHKNFNPRSVEFITLQENVADFSGDDFKNYIRENFDNPANIWKHAYLHQINLLERLFLITLLSFDEPTNIDDLSEAFDSRIALDQRAQQHWETNAFKNALERLDKGFITIRAHNINFINPSLKDFLIGFIKDDSRETMLMVESMKFIQQYSGLTQQMIIEHNFILSESLKLNLMTKYNGYIRQNHRDHDLIRLATFIQEEIENEEKNSFLSRILSDINNWEYLYEDYSLNLLFRKFLESSKDNYPIQKQINSRISEFVNELVTGENDLLKSIILLEKLQDQFDIDFENLNINRITDHLNDLFSNHISDEVAWLIDFITDPGQADEVRRKIISMENRLADIGFFYDVDMSEFEEDWNSIAKENLFREMMENDD